jgi:histidinol dehydrogenase
MFGIKKIYKIGGSHAIAAFAYGTETVPKVQKIAGPGNIYVTLAKKLLFGEVGIDLIAGPSEIVILADKTAQPEYVAHDMLSQAEHGEGATSILVTDSRNLIKEVKIILKGLLSQIPPDLPVKKLLNYGKFIAVSSLDKGINYVNEISPEHLEIITRRPRKILPFIKNAGAIFIGPYSPVAIGDYAAGPSHVLPTSGTSRFSSGITTQTFMKRMSVIHIKKNGFNRLSGCAARLAEIEGLIGHKMAIRARRT